MYSVVERIMSFASKPVPEVSKCIYTERIKCFEKLAQIQKNLKAADEEYVRVSAIEGKPDKNAWNCVEAYNTEYRKEYEICSHIMKM